MGFKHGNTYGGRKVGAVGKTPNREKVVELLNTIVEDFQTNYATLTTGQKIQILNNYRHLYAGEYFTEEDIDHFRTITVNIVNGDEKENNND